MRKHIFKNTIGFCPIVNTDIDVSIKYSEVLISGSTSEHYKAVSVNCDYSKQCTERHCPIMKENLTLEL